MKNVMMPLRNSSPNSLGMRVAHICQGEDIIVGGSVSVARALISEQRKLGIDARLVVLYNGVDEVKRESDDVPIIRCEVSRNSRWLKGIMVLNRSLRTFEPHLIHHHDGVLWPRFATIALKRPIVT